MSKELVDTAVSQAVAGHAVPVLIEKLLELPQPACDVRHIYGKGVYMREMRIAGGILIVGRVHRAAHTCLLIRGSLVMFNQDGTRTLIKSPLEFESGPGRKVARAEEDVTFVNVYQTEETDVETLEAMIYEDAAATDTRPMLSPDGDFERVLAEQGATPEQVRRASVKTEDCCPFPYGAYKVKVGRSLIEGRGLIATASIDKGEIIAPGTWGACRTPAGRYTNHAKEPNAAFAYDTKGVAWLSALRPIRGCVGATDGDEVTIDYRRTPRARWEQLS